MPISIKSQPEEAMEVDEKPELHPLTNGSCELENFRCIAPFTKHLDISSKLNIVFKDVLDRPLHAGPNFLDVCKSEAFKFEENLENMNVVSATNASLESMLGHANSFVCELSSFITGKSFLLKTPTYNFKMQSKFAADPGVPTSKCSLNSVSKSIAKSEPITTSHIKTEVPVSDGLEIVTMVNAQSKSPNLPPVGELKRKELCIASKVYVMKASLISVWVKGTVLSFRDVPPEKLFKVRFESTKSTAPKLYTAKQLAYDAPSDVIIPVGTRIIARYSEPSRSSLYAGIIAEPPKITNRERYLVFFDDGYAQYLNHEDIRVVCSQSNDVADDVHENLREFIRVYLAKYPERPMVKLQKNQYTKTEFNSEWCDTKVLDVDSSMVKMLFLASQRTEWIYRGSTRLKLLYNELANAEAHRLAGKHRRHNIVLRKPHQPYVEYTRETELVIIDSDSDGEQDGNKTGSFLHPRRKTGGGQYLNNDKPIRNTARKSTSKPSSGGCENTILFHAPDTKSHQGYKDIHQMKSYIRSEYKDHDCSFNCREKDDPARHKGKNPLLIPIFLGWERQLRRFKKNGPKIIVIYRAPCGRHLRSLHEIQDYLYLVSSRVTIDFFSLDTNLLVFRTFRPKEELYWDDDVTQGKENVPVSCVNSLSDQPPPYVEYASERFPGEGVYLNLDKNFLCGCECTDNCQNPATCLCQQLTNYAKYGKNVGDAGYKFRRLKEAIVTGIYECNELCKCGPQCGNRVVQNGLQARLQMFKTQFKGWGIRCLDDIDAGMFICIYAGQLLTEQGADEDGNQFGDEYLAELDHIEVVEKTKEGYESDVPDLDMDFDIIEAKKEEESEEPSSSSDSEINICADSDSDFESTGLRTTSSSTYSTRSRQRNNKKSDRFNDRARSSDSPSSAAMSEDSNSFYETEKKELPEISTNLNSYSIIPRPLSPTSAEIVEKAEIKRKPKLTNNASNNKVVAKKSVSMNNSFNNVVPNDKQGKYKSIRSYYGEDSLYIMDAKSKGNIGRYLNHSCVPNVFVQNVFVDTHDLRFPSVAFFAQNFIPAGTELTWDYNYEVGSVNNKVMYCYCDARSCRGRLL